MLTRRQLQSLFANAKRRDKGLRETIDLFRSRGHNPNRYRTVWFGTAQQASKIRNYRDAGIPAFKTATGLGVPVTTSKNLAKKYARSSGINVRPHLFKIKIPKRVKPATVVGKNQTYRIKSGVKPKWIRSIEPKPSSDTSSGKFKKYRKSFPDHYENL